MNALLIIGTTVGCAVVGGIAGIWYGTARDHGDFPIMVLYTMPVGAVIGGLIGVVLGSSLWA